MSLEVFGKVSISCEAKRPWHQPRADGKRRRRWLAMFVKVPWVLKTIDPDIFGDGTLIESPPEQAAANEELVWGSLMVGRAREYRKSSIQALVSDPLWKQELRGMFSPDEDIDEATMNNSWIADDSTTDEDNADSFTLTERGTFRPSSMFPFWGHDSDLPEFGYVGAVASSRNYGGMFGEWTYRMECPCGYRIRDISSNELHPVLDQLSAGGVHSISIQRLLRILDRP